MYPEKAKRDEKPKRSSRSKHVVSRSILALLFFVPGLIFVLPRLNREQFVDMALLTIMITLAVYLVYQIVAIFIASLFRMPIEGQENTDLWQESGNH